MNTTKKKYFPPTGNNVHVYDISTKVVKTKTWPHLPVCTSAFRWLEHYYCFHGNNFTRFHPVTGHVNGTYPKDARNYFMACANRGEFNNSMHGKMPDRERLLRFFFNYTFHVLQVTEVATQPLNAARSRWMPLQQTILGNLTSLKVRKSFSIFWGNNISKVQLRGNHTSATCAVIFNYKGILGMCLSKNK